MKKILLLVLAAAFVLPATAGYYRHYRFIQFEELPTQAQEFTKQHFDVSQISRIKTGRNNGYTYYNVQFNDDLKIDFDGNGQWKEIKSEDGSIPVNAIPEKIRAYITQHHLGVQMEQIKRKNNKYEVELINDVEIIFDRQFNFLKYD